MFNTLSILREGGSFDDTDIGDAPQCPAIDGIRSNGTVYIWPRVTLHDITQPHCPLPYYLSLPFNWTASDQLIGLASLQAT